MPEKAFGWKIFQISWRSTLHHQHQMFDSRILRRLDRVKVRIISTVSCVAIFFLVIFADSFVLKNDQLELQGTKSTRKVLESVSIFVAERDSPKEIVEETENFRQDYISMVPPMNMSIKERIAWFKKTLPDFEILKSTPKSLQFKNRVNDFFGSDDDDHCKVKFFMTWISPANLFGEREVLALELLFKSNPNGCLMILSRSMDSVQGSKLLDPIMKHGFKLVAVTPDLSFLLKNTPAESWFDDLKSGNKDPGEIPLAQNLSNLIRLAVLYKYGGVYLDTDFIVLKDFSGLRNSIGAQSSNAFGNWTRLNNAVLVFDKNHPLLYKFIEEFASTFNGNRWGHNGPYLVSRVASKFATSKDLNFSILPPMAFYPVYWTRIEGFFRKPLDQATSKWVDAKLLQLSGETYGVHLWNKQSSRLRIEEGSVMGRLISEHCIICNHLYSS
ncbi:lactosylceramide 4-alpha-galactosyltransferase-like [Heracleum sosnowskyi]|uniref:Lactosylceramide 4-alpha-galactosyltransferase-like n=1 Tax=Heracleum sosnowskyi TaxID=360622 RepID=A0AAD8M155_9APIA|nr:lactosylceramide 4-alpha-galactosyltransferase-like [Heracleum sosnowskyi]